MPSKRPAQRATPASLRAGAKTAARRAVQPPPRKTPAPAAEAAKKKTSASKTAALPPPAVRARHRAFPIVGIGASAGGLKALEALFAHMPPDAGLAFVVVTHQHPGHTSMLPELLSKGTRLRVVEAADGMRVQPNCVYVGAPGGHLALLNGVLHRMETGKTEAPHLPIDYFLRSLAEDQKERAICMLGKHLTP